MKNERANGLPKEVQELALREKIGKEYPSLYTEDFLLVNTQTTLLAIDDISYRSRSSIQDEIEMLILSCKGWVEVYDARALTKILAQKLCRLLDVVNTQRALIFFPGNGAKVVKDLLPENLLSDLVTIEIPARRKIAVNGAVERVTLSDITRLRKIATEMNLGTLIVLDDVIVTGATLTAVREALPARTVQAFAGSLFTLSPFQNRRRANTPSSIESYNSIITSVIYQGTTGIPPLNSLSTLIGSSEKSKAVRTKYIEDYVEEKEAFLSTVQLLQEKCMIR